MEEEINLRPYFETITRGWYWLVTASVLAAIIAYAVSSSIAPTYEATALVVIAEPRQRVQFDPRIETVTESQPLNAYPELAMSDEVMLSLLSTVELADVETVGKLRDLLVAEAGSAASLLQLRVQYKDPDVAALVANNWASFFVEWVNE
ncbi:MAG: hypothetical protein KDE28_12425, partial [Anaerolineales bacterium]|nr:hypothetical protein [Anaerolineales bacterium]